MDNLHNKSESAAAGEVPESSLHSIEPAEIGIMTPVSEGDEMKIDDITEVTSFTKLGSSEVEVAADIDLRSKIQHENTEQVLHAANCATDEIQSIALSDAGISRQSIAEDLKYSANMSTLSEPTDLDKNPAITEELMDITESNEKDDSIVCSPSREDLGVSTPTDQGPLFKTIPQDRETPASTATKKLRGRKRKVAEDDIVVTPTKAPKTPGRSRVYNAKVKLSYADYVSLKVGDRVLSCGEGEQLGHPGRTTTKKPRRVDIVEDEGLKVVQIVAGGVHSALLTIDGEVYMCGINEQGTVPAIGVEAEGSTDKFTKVELTNEMRSQGKIVMLAAGASFTAALTDKGSVIVWGNLRDTSGEINVHPLLTKMKDHPVVLIHYKKRVIVKIAAGENHLVMLEEDGKVLTFGDGKMGQLGRSKRTGSIRPQYMVDEDGRSLILILQDKRRRDIPVKDIHAGGFWTMLVTDDQVFSFGLNNFEHLGIPIKGEAPTDASMEDKRELRILTPSVANAYLGRKWTHIDGVQHIIARDLNGEVFGIGKNTDNALGLGTWTGNDDSEHWKYTTLERVQFPPEAGKIAGTTAKLACSIAWTESGDAYAWGCDTSGQLGLGLKDDDDRVVPKPQKITSAHLDGYKVISASISDNHSLFLAIKK